VVAIRILAAQPRILAIFLVVIFAVQGMQLACGTNYRTSVPWDGGPWFEVSVPAALNSTPHLYFLIGEESESFVAPFLGSASGFVNLDGDYVLGPDGANGARIRSLIEKYAPHLRVAIMASEYEHFPTKELADPSHVDDALAPFGLRADMSDCSIVSVGDMRRPWRKVLTGTLPISLPQITAPELRVPISPTGYLLACRVVMDPGSRLALAAVEREPNLVFDRMENECPQLFQPPRPVTEAYGDSHHGYLWMRKYPGTNVTAVLSDGALRLADGARGGHPMPLGREGDWLKGPVPLECARRGGSYYAKPISAH
jgi:hypothetical protein